MCDDAWAKEGCRVCLRRGSGIAGAICIYYSNHPLAAWDDAVEHVLNLCTETSTDYNDPGDLADCVHLAVLAAIHWKRRGTRCPDGGFGLHGMFCSGVQWGSLGSLGSLVKLCSAEQEHSQEAPAELGTLDPSPQTLDPGLWTIRPLATWGHRCAMHNSLSHGGMPEDSLQ